RNFHFSQNTRKPRENARVSERRNRRATEIQKTETLQIYSSALLDLSHGDDRDRTGNPCLAKAVLSQLSYVPGAQRDRIAEKQKVRSSTETLRLCHSASLSQWAHQDSNLGPQPY